MHIKILHLNITGRFARLHACNAHPVAQSSEQPSAMCISPGGEGPEDSSGLEEEANEHAHEHACKQTC